MSAAACGRARQAGRSFERVFELAARDELAWLVARREPAQHALGTLHSLDKLSCSSIGLTPPSPSGRGGTTLPRQRAPRSCTVFVMTPPTSEGGRDDRGVPYRAEPTLSSAQVLKVSMDALLRG